MPVLAGAALRRTLRLSLAAGSAWALMVGLAAAYFNAIALHLGASPLQLGLVVALPLALGGLGPCHSSRWGDSGQDAEAPWELVWEPIIAIAYD